MNLNSFNKNSNYIIGVTSIQLLYFAVFVILILISTCLFLIDKCNKLDSQIVAGVEKFNLLDRNLDLIKLKLNNLELEYSASKTIHVVPVNAVNSYDSALMRDILYYFVIFIGIVLAIGALSYGTSFIISFFQKNFLVKSLIFVNTKLMSLFNQVNTKQNDAVISDFIEYVDPITNSIIRHVLKESDGLGPGLYVNHLDWGWKVFPEFLSSYVEAHTNPLVAADTLEQVTAGLSTFMSS